LTTLHCQLQKFKKKFINRKKNCPPVGGQAGEKSNCRSCVSVLNGYLAASATCCREDFFFAGGEKIALALSTSSMRVVSGCVECDRTQPRNAAATVRAKSDEVNLVSISNPPRDRCLSQSYPQMQGMPTVFLISLKSAEFSWFYNAN
jgi:hypothetical protein